MLSVNENRNESYCVGVEQVSRLEGHTESVNSVAWSPSGEKLASASSDKTVMVWDASSGAQVKDSSQRAEPACFGINTVVRTELVFM
jgi:WD40 repeat protein